MNAWQAVRVGLAWLKVYAGFEAWALRTHPAHCAARMGVRDISIFYKEYGEGEPLLMLHGGFGYLEHWCAQIKELSAHYRVIALDSRGHGRSTLGDEPLTYRGMAGDISEFIERMELGPVHLLGWSDGGCTGLALALQRPDLVRSMVLLGTPFSTGNYSPEAKELIRIFLRPYSPGLLALMFIRRLMTPEPASAKKFLERISAMWTDLPDFAPEELRGIETPTLVIAGDKDEYLSAWPDPLKVFRETAEAIPGAGMVVVPGGTHGLHMSHARQVNEHILTFLESLEDAAPQ